MIIVKQNRVKDGTEYPSADREMGAFEALKFMIKFELAFGTEVFEMNDTSLKMVTNVMGCIDTTIFEGECEEMEWINKAAAVYTMIRSKMFLPEFRDKMVAKVMHFTSGNPLLVETCSLQILGGSFAKGTVVAMLMEADPTQVEVLAKYDISELLTMLEWKVVDNLALSDILEVAA